MRQLWPTDTQRRSTQTGAIGATLLLIVSALTIVFGMSTEETILKPYPVYPRPAFVPAHDPIEAVLEGFRPAPLSSNERPSVDVRAIVVYPTGVVQYLAGAPFRSITRKGTGVYTLPEISSMVNDPRWMEVANSTVSLHCALITVGLTELDISAPTVSSVDLDQHHGAFLAASGGTFRLSSVKVSSSQVAAGTPLHPKFRPFVLVTGDVQLQVEHSVFEHLGWDWSSSYGLSIIGAVKGSIVDSDFRSNFFGVYTQLVDGLEITDSRFVRNLVYGIDPHSGSTHLQILRNLATHNGSHGIIVSRDVTDSTIADNISTHNGEDGIVVDEKSNRVLVKNNTVRFNTGDGLVVSGSKSAKIIGNDVRRNRIGIRLQGNSTAIVSRNAFVGNVIPSQGIELSPVRNHVGVDHNTRVVPPPSWHVLINVILWPAVAILCLLAIFERRRERSRFKDYYFSNDPDVQ